MKISKRKEIQVTNICIKTIACLLSAPWNVNINEAYDIHDIYGINAYFLQEGSRNTIIVTMDLFPGPNIDT